MKKVILISMILCGIIATPSFSMAEPTVTNEPEPAPKGIRSLEIDADVTVVLGYFGNKQAFIDGDEQFMQHIIIIQNGSHLKIRSRRSRDFKSNGVIYVSAEMLNEISINSAALVQSSGSLQIPRLDVMINGPCEIMIANTGDLNLVPMHNYDVEYKTKRKQQPLTFYWSEKK